MILIIKKPRVHLTTKLLTKRMANLQNISLNIKESDLVRHRAIFRVILIVSIPASLLFSLANFYRGLILLPILEATIFVFSVYFLVISKKTPHIREMTIGFTVFIILTIFAGISSPNSSITMLVWVYVLPIMAYSTMGRFYGMLFSAVSYVFFALQIVWRYGDFLDSINNIHKLNLIVCAIVIWALVHVYENARSNAHSMLLEVAGTDVLTGVNNRLGLEEAFEKKRSTIVSNKVISGLIVLDLDLFKVINDTRGHPCGDKVLQQVARALKATVRAEESIFRFGGEEFCILVNCKNLESLESTAESIRKRIETLKIIYKDEEVPITCSIGAVLISETDKSFESTLNEADKNLYQAKVEGRNRVITSA